MFLCGTDNILTADMRSWQRRAPRRTLKREKRLFNKLVAYSAPDVCDWGIWDFRTYSIFGRTDLWTMLVALGPTAYREDVLLGHYVFLPVQRIIGKLPWWLIWSCEHTIKRKKFCWIFSDCLTETPLHYTYYYCGQNSLNDIYRT